MVITGKEKKMADCRLTPATAKSNHDSIPTQSALSDAEVDIAALLADELRSSMHRYDDAFSDFSSDVLLDREINGYRIILLRASGPPEHNMNSLSPREREIARMVAKGYPNKTIAAVLEISTWTVGTHLRRMFAKLGVNSRAAMVAQLTHHMDAGK